MKTLMLAALLSISGLLLGQTTIITQRFSSTAPSGWSSTSSVWNFAYNGSSTGNYRSVEDATTYSARFPSADNGNSIYIYIPVNFTSGNSYAAKFYTKRVCSVEFNTNELPNQTTLLSTETKTNSSCGSNFDVWYEWSFVASPAYTGAGYIQIWAKTIYGGPISAYLDDITVVESSSSLPIELLYFKGEKLKGKNRLYWSTASEADSDFFEIERSTDAVEWKAIAREAAAGNSYEQRYYSLDDIYEHDAINYYRLKQVDYDGEYRRFDIIAIDNRAYREREVVKITNMLGQEVDIRSYRGIVIIRYSDGTSENKIN